MIIISMKYRLLVAENCPKLFFCHIFSSKQNSQPLQMFTVDHFLKVKMLLHYHSNDILAVMCSYAATKQEKGIENKIHNESKEKMLSFFPLRRLLLSAIDKRLCFWFGLSVHSISNADSNGVFTCM